MNRGIRRRLYAAQISGGRGSSVSAIDRGRRRRRPSRKPLSQGGPVRLNFENRAALLIAFLAMLLAITSVAGNDNLQAILQAEMQEIDTWAVYQAKTIQRTSTLLAKDQIELQLLSQGPSWPAEAREVAAAKLAAYESEADRLSNEPGEGTQDLLAKGREWEAIRERAMNQDPNFDYAEGLFGIAIVTASVSIITRARALLWGAAALGIIALALLLNGFYLFVELPGSHWVSQFWP